MHGRKVYTKEECRQAVETLVAAAKTRKDELDVPRSVIDEHPWMLKFLSHFSEANGFFHFVRLPGARVEEYVVPDNILKFRMEKGMNPQLKFRVTADDESEWKGGIFIFTFEEISFDRYVCLAG